jgi:hypothetical protein
LVFNSPHLLIQSFRKLRRVISAIEPLTVKMHRVGIEPTTQ